MLNDKHLRIWGIPVMVVAVLLLQMPFYFPGRWDLFFRYAVVSVAFTVLMWEIARVIVVRFRQRLPGLDQTKQRIAWQFCTFCVQLGIGQWLLTKMVIRLGWSISEEPFLKVWLINFAYSLFFIVLIVGIYEAIYFFGQYKSTLQKAEYLKKQQAQQRFDALKTRVNPHFLFNSLTTLSALIGEDAPRAERFVDELSRVYRYLLKAGRHPVVTLGEELQFAESYAFLLKNRFEDGAFSLVTKLASGLDTSPEPQYLLERESLSYLPALSIQHCLDYFVRTQHLPLHIEVVAFEKHLLVTSPNRPKSLSFDASDNDWRQLAAVGAWTEAQHGRLEIKIPFTQKDLVE